MHQKVRVTTGVMVTVNNYLLTRPFVSSHFSDGDGRPETLGQGFMLCLTLSISSWYRSLIYPCITISIGGHRRLTQSTHQICRPTYNRSEAKRPSAILSLQNFDTLMYLILEPNYAAAHQISLKSDDIRS